MKKTVKRIIKIVSVVLAFVVLNQCAYWAVSSPSFSRWSNHDVKVYKDKTDTAFFGTSHIYAAINPEVFDAETGCFCMNCGSGGQGIKQTYYYIKQMNTSCENLKTVFVDLYFEDFQQKKDNRGSEMQDKMIIYSRLTNPIAKLDYIANTFEINEYQYILFPALYYNSSIENIPSNIKQKLSSEYRNYGRKCSFFTDPYEGRGYIPFTNYDINDEKRLHFADHIQYTKDVNEEAFEYMTKIVDYCKEQNLRLVFVQMPMTSIANNENKAFIQYFDKIIDEYIEKNHLTYYNINVSADRSEVKDKKFFADFEHLSLIGSEYFTKVIADYYNSLSGE